MPRFDQRALFCRTCGQPPAVAGFCAPCYHRRRRSLRFFAGLREEVLRRDRYRCGGCGSPDQRAVHHRRPGVHDFRWLITLCPACHAVVHKLRAHRRWLPVSLLELWREQHPSVPQQLQIEIGGLAQQGREDRPPEKPIPGERRFPEQESERRDDKRGSGQQEQGPALWRPPYIEGWDSERPRL